eukprot:TRINITY_DN5018_c0_g1_i4.p1 TRINITY_DN5018_c0_g1~~TRINITY_DN5018_c0_g1_i4.p1  ORF type:complete len:209 (+),score=21.70 TRINITY_DN5018_c0_g1_i4:235-861(+)
MAALYVLLVGIETPFPDRPLQEFSIGNNKFTQEDFSNLMVSVSQNKSLKMLDISGLGLSEGCIKLVSTIIRFDKKINELDISNNEMGPEHCKVILSALARNRNLKKLRVCNIGINNTLLRTLKLGLTYNSGLKELYLDNNSITESGLYDIKEIFLTNKVLEVISIEGNPIKTLKVLSDNVEKISKLLECDFKIMTRYAYLKHLKLLDQ